MQQKQGIKTTVVVGIATALFLWYINKSSDNLTRHLTASERKAALEDVVSNPNLGLKKGEWNEYGFLKKYKETIREYASIYELPPSFVAAIIYEENIARKHINDLTDKIKSFLKGDVSLGPGQVKLDTAMYLSGAIPSQRKSDFEKTDKKTRTRFILELNDPESNIYNTVKYLRYLLNVGGYDRRNSSWLRGNQEALGITANRYGRGTDENRVGQDGKNVLETMNQPWMLALFPEDKIRKEKPFVLEKIVNTKEVIEIKQKLGKGMSLYETSKYKDSYQQLSETYKSAMAIENKTEWGQGKEYYDGLAVVSLMYKARCLLDTGMATKKDYAEAARIYKLAAQIRYSMDKAEERGVHLPEAVGNPPVKVASYDFIKSQQEIAIKNSK